MLKFLTLILLLAFYSLPSQGGPVASGTDASAARRSSSKSTTANKRGAKKSAYNKKSLKKKKIQTKSVQAKKNAPGMQIKGIGDKGRWFVGAHIGLIQVNKTGGPEPGDISGLGALVGHHKGKWKLSANFFQAKFKEGFSNGIQNSSDTFLFFGGSYEYWQRIYVGAKLGQVNRLIDLAGAGELLQDSGIGIGGDLGYDIVLSEQILLTIEFSYLRAMKSEVTDPVSGSSISFRGIDYYNYSAKIAYYF